MGSSDFRGKWIDFVARTFGRYGSAVASPLGAGLAIVLSLVIMAAMIPGLTDIEIESNIENLYVVEGTRLDKEVDFYTEHYGIAQQHMSIVTASDGISTAGVAASLDAEIAAWTGVLKDDEGHRCSTFDGSSVESIEKIKEACSVEPYASKSLYCNCDVIASNPDMVTIEYNGTSLSAKDICDSPEVPPAYMEGKLASFKITDDEFGSTGSAYRAGESALVAALQAASPQLFNATAEPGKSFILRQEAWREDMLNHVREAEEQLMEAESVTDSFGYRYKTSVADSGRQAAAKLTAEITVEDFAGISNVDLSTAASNAPADVEAYVTENLGSLISPLQGVNSITDVFLKEYVEATLVESLGMATPATSLIDGYAAGMNAALDVAAAAVAGGIQDVDGNPTTAAIKAAANEGTAARQAAADAGGSAGDAMLAYTATFASELITDGSVTIATLDSTALVMASTRAAIPAYLEAASATVGALADGADTVTDAVVRAYFDASIGTALNIVATATPSATNEYDETKSVCTALAKGYAARIVAASDPEQDEGIAFGLTFLEELGLDDSVHDNTELANQAAGVFENEVALFDAIRTFEGAADFDNAADLVASGNTADEPALAGLVDDDKAVKVGLTQAALFVDTPDAQVLSDVIDQIGRDSATAAAAIALIDAGQDLFDALVSKDAKNAFETAFGGVVVTAGISNIVDIQSAFPQLVNVIRQTNNAMQETYNADPTTGTPDLQRATASMAAQAVFAAVAVETLEDEAADANTMLDAWRAAAFEVMFTVQMLAMQEIPPVVVVADVFALARTVDWEVAGLAADRAASLFILASREVEGAHLHAKTCSDAIANIVVKAATQAQYHSFVSEGNVVTQGFQQIASCVADYAEINAEEVSARGYLSNRILSMVDDSLTETVGMLPQPAMCRGECHGVSCNGLPIAKDAIWDVLASGINPLDADGNPHPQLCNAGKTYVEAVLGTMGYPASGTNILVDPIVREFLDRGLADTMSLPYDPDHTLTNAFYEGMKAALEVCAPEGVKAMNASALNPPVGNPMDVSIITEADFYKAGEIGIMANSLAQVDGMSFYDAQFVSAAEIGFYVCSIVAPTIYPPEDHDALIPKMAEVARLGYEAELADPNKTRAEITTDLTGSVLALGIGLSQMLWLSPCLDGAEGFARKIEQDEWGKPAFKNAFRAAAQIDDAAPDDLYTFDTVIGSFAIDAGLLQIVGVSGINASDPCQDGIGAHDDIMATVATSGLFDNSSFTLDDIEAKVNATEVKILEIMECTATAAASIGAAVGAEHSFLGKPDANGVPRTAAHFTADYWNEATVNYTARPLPRTWGVDRFPCGRATALDTFREGDFDYPYQLKQLQQVAFQTYMFAAGSPLVAGQREEAQCIEHGFLNPLKQQRYLNALGNDFSESNANAIEAAETSFESDLGSDILVPPVTTAAGQAIVAATDRAAVAFVAAGGDVYHAPDQAWLLSTTSVVDAAAAGLTSAEVSAAAAAVISSAIVDGVSDAADLATTFAEAASGTSATGADADAIEAGLAGRSPYTASGTVFGVSLHPTDLAGEGLTFSKGLLDAALTVALLVPNILLPRVREVIGSAVQSVATTEATFASQKDWACGEDRTGDLETSMQLLMSLGYWWRPSYGEHWSYDRMRDNLMSVTEGIEEAAKVYYRDTFRDSTTWEPQECLTHNDDTEQLLGNQVPACMLPWAPQMGMPIGLSIGDITWRMNASDATALYTAEIELGRTSEQAIATVNNAKAQSGIERIGAFRLAMNDFAPTHWLHAARLDAAIGLELTDEDRESIHASMQDAYIAHLEQFWLRNVTSFEEGGRFGNTTFDFAAGKSIADIIDSSTDVEIAPMAAVYVIMILYVGGSLLGWKSNIRSHFWVGIAGVVIIALSVVTSLGIAAWAGILFTPLVTNVAPFVALGIGIDDMLVIAHEYASLLRKDAARPVEEKRYVVSGSIQPGKLGYYKFTGNVPLLMKDVLEGTGPSVFFTTLTNLIGFAVASICPIVVVELLAKVMAICVVVNFSFLFLIFLPVVYLDACRSLKRGFRECSCFSIFCSEPTENEVFTADKIGTKSKGKAEEGGAAAGNALKEEVISKALEHSYGPFLMKPVVKAVVLVLFAIFFSIQLWQLVSKSELGLKYADITEVGTYQYDFYNILEEQFVYYNQYIVATADNFASISTQVGVQMATKNFVLADLVEKSAMAGATGVSWMSMLQMYKSTPDCVAADVATMFSTNVLDGYEKLDYCTLVNVSSLDISEAFAGEAASQSSSSFTETSYPTVPEEDFYYAFGSFMNGLGALMAGQFVCKNTTSDQITPCFSIPAAWPKDGTPVEQQSRDVVLVAAMEQVFVKDAYGVPEQLELIRDTRRYVDSCHIKYAAGDVSAAIGSAEPVDAGFWAFPTGYTYRFNAQYLYTKEDMVRTVGYAALGIFIATFVFMLSWKSSLILCFVIVSTVIELAGLIPESDASLKNGLRLNAFSIVNLTICVGMAVEFTAHIVHCFITTQAEDSADGRSERVISALGTMGPAVIHGGITSLIASAVLAMSGIPFIQQYYFFMFFFMVVIASVNGFVLLPVLLSLFGDDAAGDGQGRISVANADDDNDDQTRKGGITVSDSALGY